MTSIITLTTDFGTADGYVGAMKGRILTLNPKANIVDITHEIEPQGIRQVAWCLLRAVPSFPEESVHVAVVDPGVGSERHAILLRSGNRWFVGPDNGIFSGIIGQFGQQEGFSLHRETPWWKKHRSFDGCALFAPAAACLTIGIDPVEMGVAADDFILLDDREPVCENNTLTGEIVMFDRFGNGLTNISEVRLGELSKKTLSVAVMGQVFEIADHYQAGSESKGLALINSDGFLELSVFGGSARDVLNLKVGDPVVVS